MTIQSICTGTIVKRKVYSRTAAIGPAGGDATAGVVDSRSRECGAQDDSGGVDTRSDAEANRSRWVFFFSEDPGLGLQDEIIVSKHQGTTYATPRTFRVNGTHVEGSPNGSLRLWVVEGEEF